MEIKGQKRGGARVGAGRKPKDPPNIPFEIEETPVLSKKEVVKEFMTAEQSDGMDFKAESIFLEITSWLERHELRQYANTHLLEMYAMEMARWIQAENKISEYGFLAKHPTTGAPIISPYVTISLEFSKQASSTWWQIAQAIKEGSNGKAKVEEPSNSLLNLLKNA